MAKSATTKQNLIIRIMVIIVIISFVIIMIYDFDRRPSVEQAEVTPPAEQQEFSAIDQEINNLETLWHTHGNHPPIALKLAQLFSEKKDYLEAVRYYKIFLLIDTTSVSGEVRLDLSRAWYLAGQGDSARVVLQSILEENPDHQGGLYNLGALEANLGNSEDAQRIWKELIEKYPKGEMTHMALQGLELLKKKVGE